MITAQAENYIALDRGTRPQRLKPVINAFITGFIIFFQTT
jgi:hypothetical protein